jgi:hypothetical protein
MLKYLVPVVILIAGLPAGQAEAARCPVGQIYRVSLKVCAPREGNVKYLHHARTAHKTQRTVVRGVAKVLPPPRPDALAGVAEPDSAFPPTYVPQPVPLNQAGGPVASPYGVVR